MRIFKSAILLFGVLVTACVTGASSVSASTVAASFADLEIGAIGYNAYGADTVANRNAEYADIKNTSATEEVSVKGLIVEDAWRHGQPDTYKGVCNRYTVTGVPQADGSTTEMLPAGHVLRVYVGAGKTRVFTWQGVTYHAVYADSPPRCGYNGHIWNNGPGKNRVAPWDVVWIVKDGATKSKGYNFSFGYVAR